MYVNIPQLIRLLRNSTVNIIYVDVMLTFVPSQGETECVFLYLMLVVSVRSSKEGEQLCSSRRSLNHEMVLKYSARPYSSVIQLQTR